MTLSEDEGRQMREALEALLDGHSRFRGKYWEQYKNRFSALARNGQSPFAMIIACSDSRVAPEMIFDCAPGEIFVVRNVSNLVPPYAPDTGNHGTSAALEFAVMTLGVSAIIVLGHSQCGGIHALMKEQNTNRGDFIASWMVIAQAARQDVYKTSEKSASFEELCYRCELASIKVSLENLLSFPWIRSRVAVGELSLTGLHFNVQMGTLEMVHLENESG